MGRAGGHAGRRGIYCDDPPRAGDPGIRLDRSRLHRRVAPCASGAGGFPRPAEGELRAIRRAGFYTVIVASLAQILGVVVLLAGSTALEWLVFPVGLLGVVVGFVLYGAATLQARVLPRWCGVGFIVGLPAWVVLGEYGGILFGLLWLTLGYLLWSRSGTATEGASRVS